MPGPAHSRSNPEFLDRETDPQLDSRATRRDCVIHARTAPLSLGSPRVPTVPQPTEHQHQDRIVVTGTGLITALGVGTEVNWSALLAGGDGVGPLHGIDFKGAPDKGGGQAPGLSPDSLAGIPPQARRERAAAYLFCCAQECVHSAGLEQSNPYAPARRGMIVGTTLGGMNSGGVFLESCRRRGVGRARFGEMRRWQPSAVMRPVLDAFALAGAGITTTTACASGLSSIGLAMMMLRSSRLDLIIAGGYDPMCVYTYAGFNSLMLVDGEAIRPFDAKRKGLKIGEGYGLLALERRANALRRGARILGEVVGYGESSDAHHLTRPHPDGQGAVRAMRIALTDARLRPDQIDHINAHGTATPNNDSSEYRAMERVFGTHLRRIPVSAVKSALGHALGGAGGVEAIFTLLAIRSGIAPATLHTRCVDSAMPDLDLVTDQPRVHPIRHAMSNSFGFGGSNASLILGACDE